MVSHESHQRDRRTRIQQSAVERYRRMVEIRVFEDTVRDLFGSGEIRGTTHTSHGQEAVSVGVAAAAGIEDRVLATYRGHAIALALGMTPKSVLGEIMGKSVGAIGGMGGSMHLSDLSVGLLPTSAIVGAGIPMAAGAALTAQVRGEKTAAIALFGDGASNIGAFHEGLNLAAIWNLPVLFVCENNMYGEYSRIDKTTPIENIADRARSYSMASEIVDGQDVEAVRCTVEQSLARIRAGSGPILLEMKTYRFAGHSRSDTAPYRPEGELEQWQERDPLRVAAKDLERSGHLSAQDKERVADETKAAIEAVVAEVRGSADPVPESMFSHVWAGQQGDQR